MHCGCTGSPFVDKDLKHIITDSFKIIENKKLRKLFSKGLKYCEKRIINYQKAKERTIMVIKSSIQSWCDKHCVNISSFSQWKQLIKKSAISRPK